MCIDDKFSKLMVHEDDRNKDHTNTIILDKYADKIKTDELSFTRGKITKDKADRATVENVLDPRTMRFLRGLVMRGIISELNGCLSTGKEANVYHAFAGNSKLIDNTESRIEYAVKIYKTSILVFKDRERYVDGEFRFRNSRSQHNPRKMIKIWAEKEFRNLKRIYQSGVIPCPEPIEIRSNVLVMEFLNRGDGFASPRLKNYPFKDQEEITYYYHTLIAYIRLLYQVCQLVHADLSEYNTIVHQDKLYIIDVSQSVQPEHPMSLDFLRMDIKNINLYFKKMGIYIFSERIIFQFVISEQLDRFKGDYHSTNDLRKYVSEHLPLKLTLEDEAEDEIFRSLYLVRNLGGLEEKDFDRFTNGKFDLLTSIIANDNVKNAKNFNASEQFELSSSEDDSDNLNEETYTSNENDDSDTDDHSDEDEPDRVKLVKDLKGKKYEDKDIKRLRKQEAKNIKRDKRKTKMKKYVKKKLTKTKSKK